MKFKHIFNQDDSDDFAVETDDKKFPFFRRTIAGWLRFTDKWEKVLASEELEEKYLEHIAREEQ